METDICNDHPYDIQEYFPNSCIKNKQYDIESFKTEDEGLKK